MGTLSRKQREVKEREERLLDLARAMLIEQGYAGLSMDRLAEAAEYSKGTVYQHFCSKEDLVSALAIQSEENRTALFERALAFRGRTRERMLAIGVAEELFVRLHPFHFRSESIIKMADLEDRASPERQGKLKELEGCCFGTVVKIVDEAVEQGDLTLPPGILPADLVLALWAIQAGTHQAIHNYRSLLLTFGVTAPFRVLRLHENNLLDGYGWKPLGSEWDYQDTFRRIAREIFPDECLRAGLD